MNLFLDTGCLSLAIHPGGGPDAKGCAVWLNQRIQAGDTIILPEIADYELRRELIRAGKLSSVNRLDSLRSLVDYLPITTQAMRRAAERWAEARNQGIPTAADAALDADMILVAIVDVAPYGGDHVIATTDVGDLSRFHDARRWQDIF